MAIVRAKVKPERELNRDRSRREYWWRFTRPTPELYNSIEDLSRVLVLTLHGKTVMPEFVPTNVVFSHGVAVIAYDDDAHFALLTSAVHWWWAVTRASTMRTDIRYTPTDCFETFSQPDLTASVADAGRRLHAHRRHLMLERWEGLTKTYNRFHSPSEGDSDVAELRRLHTDLDHAVAASYGWDDLSLDHDFHETRQGIRYTIGPSSRTEILDRLMELNHKRYAEEARLGLHDKPGRRGKGRSGPKKPARPGPDQTSLLT